MTLLRGFGGLDQVIRNLSSGSNLIIAGHKSPDPFVVTVNVENGPGGDLQSRPCYLMEDLKDPDTGYNLAATDPVIRVSLFQRLRSAPLHILCTSTRAFEYRSRQNIVWDATNKVWLGGGRLIKIHTWDRPVSAVGTTEWNGRFYFATGVNDLMEWDGIGAFVDVSAGWDEGYRKPSCVCSYASLLIAAGFQDTAAAVQASEIRATDTSDALTLLPYSTLLRTLDPDIITAVWAAPWALLVFKHNNTFRITGSDFQMFTDIDQRVLTPGVGCVGPMAVCSDDHGAIYHMSKDGIYVILNPQDPAHEISAKISPIFGKREAMTRYPYPVAASDTSNAVLAYNPLMDQVLCTITGASA